MNFSQKVTAKCHNALCGGLAKAAFVVGVALWFCSSYCLPSDVSAEKAGPVMTEAYEKELLERASEAIEEECFVRPADGMVTSEFGSRWGRNHNGIDIGADTGTEIYAAADGKVVFADVLGGYGNYVKIEHKDGLETAYAHCSSIETIKGKDVKAGELIAYVGSTGNSTGPHLHFEVKKNGEFCNPREYVLY